MKEELKNKLTEEEAKEIIKEMVGICPTGEIAIDASLFNLKQAGIIRQSAKEELENYLDSVKTVFISMHPQGSCSCQDVMVDGKLFKEEILKKLKALTEASSISEEVIKAREKTDEQIQHVRNFYTINGKSDVIDYLEKLIAIERQAK